LNILQWLKVGIALFLAISKPSVEIQKENVKIHFEISNIVTDEIATLINNGVEFEYEAYISLIAVDASNKKNLFKNRVRRKIKYDYLNNTYYLSENNNLLIKYDSLENLLIDAKKYPNIIFNLNSNNYTSYSFFIEISLIENPMIEEKLKMKTSDLWNGYRPSIKYNCDKNGVEIK